MARRRRNRRLKVPTGKDPPPKPGEPWGPRGGEIDTTDKKGRKITPLPGAVPPPEDKVAPIPVAGQGFIVAPDGRVIRRDASGKTTTTMPDGQVVTEELSEFRHRAAQENVEARGQMGVPNLYSPPGTYANYDFEPTVGAVSGVIQTIIRGPEELGSKTARQLARFGGQREVATEPATLNLAQLRGVRAMGTAAIKLDDGEQQKRFYDLGKQYPQVRETAEWQQIHFATGGGADFPKSEEERQAERQRGVTAKMGQIDRIVATTADPKLRDERIQAVAAGVKPELWGIDGKDPMGNPDPNEMEVLDLIRRRQKAIADGSIEPESGAREIFKLLGQRATGKQTERERIEQQENERQRKEAKVEAETQRKETRADEEKLATERLDSAKFEIKEARDHLNDLSKRADAGTPASDEEMQEARKELQEARQEYRDARRARFRLRSSRVEGDETGADEGGVPELTIFDELAPPGEIEGPGPQAEVPPAGTREAQPALPLEQPTTAPTAATAAPPAETDQAVTAGKAEEAGQSNVVVAESGPSLTPSGCELIGISRVRYMPLPGHRAYTTGQKGVVGLMEQIHKGGAWGDVLALAHRAGDLSDEELKIIHQYITEMKIPKTKARKTGT